MLLSPCVHHPCVLICSCIEALPTVCLTAAGEDTAAAAGGGAAAEGMAMGAAGAGTAAAAAAAVGGGAAGCATAGAGVGSAGMEMGRWRGDAVERQARGWAGRGREGRTTQG